MIENSEDEKALRALEAYRIAWAQECNAIGVPLSTGEMEAYSDGWRACLNYVVAERLRSDRLDDFGRRVLVAVLNAAERAAELPDRHDPTVGRTDPHMEKFAEELRVELTK